MRPWRRTRSRASGACRAATCSSSPGPTSTASRCCRRRRRKASAPPSLPIATRRSSATWSRTLNCSNDDFIGTREERHKRASQELWRRMQAAGDIYLDKYAGWYSVRDEAYYDESELKDGRRRNQAFAARHAGRVGRGGELFLPARVLSGQAARILRGASRVHRARHPRQRSEELRARRAARPLDLAHDLRLGHSRPRRSETHHVCVGRCAHQLHYRRRLSRRGVRRVPALLARRRAYHRQGHHPLPRGLLAGIPDVGGRRLAEAGVRPRLPL